MRAHVLGATGLSCAIFCTALPADFAGSVSVTSDYDYRGFSQSAGDPALQGDLGYEHASGFYATVWGSSLDWGDDSDAVVELDWTAGFSREIGETGVAWDAGVLFYQYPDLSSANFVEFYGGLSWSLFHVKLSYSDDFAGVGESAWYADGGLGWEWDNGVGIFAYGGYSFGHAFDADRGLAFGSPDYWNYGFGVGYTANERFYFEVKAVGSDHDGPHRIRSGVFDNSFRGVLSASLAFP